MLCYLFCFIYCQLSVTQQLIVDAQQPNKLTVNNVYKLPILYSPIKCQTLKKNDSHYDKKSNEDVSMSKKHIPMWIKAETVHYIKRQV